MLWRGRGHRCHTVTYIDGLVDVGKWERAEGGREQREGGRRNHWRKKV